MTLRGRVNGVTKNEAGNYITIPLIRASNLENPLAVRKFLQDRSDSTKTWNYPKSDEVSTEPGGISTNWATFYHDVKIPGFKQKLHLPVISSLTRNINGLEVCPTIGQCVL